MYPNLKPSFLKGSGKRQNEVAPLCAMQAYYRQSVCFVWGKKNKSWCLGVQISWKARNSRGGGCQLESLFLGIMPGSLLNCALNWQVCVKYLQCSSSTVIQDMAPIRSGVSWFCSPELNTVWAMLFRRVFDQMKVSVISGSNVLLCAQEGLRINTITKSLSDYSRTSPSCPVCSGLLY